MISPRKELERQIADERYWCIFFASQRQHFKINNSGVFVLDRTPRSSKSAVEIELHNRSNHSRRVKVNKTRIEYAK